MASDNDRRIGLEILKKVRSLQLPLKLDNITEGRGNCFPLAILAQCRRSEIFQQLDGSIHQIIYQNDPTGLRQQVHRFMVNSTHPKIQEYKRRYQEVISVIDNRSWNEYWEVMIRNYEWADYIFIQSTAWFLGYDIIIVTTTSTESHPYITISGNMNDESLPSPGIPLLIGSKSQVHFQSLLPSRVQKKELAAKSPVDSIKMQVSVESNSKQKKDLMQGIKPENLLKRQPDLDSLDDFPVLQPSKALKQKYKKTSKG